MLDVASCSICATAGSKAAKLSGEARASGARRRGARTARMVDNVGKECGKPWSRVQLSQELGTIKVWGKQTPVLDSGV